MADQTERLSASAQKGKRNLLFFGVVAWVLALGWLRLDETATKVALLGIAVTSSIPVVFSGLCALIGYNLVSFWLHGPFGDSRKIVRGRILLHPEKALEANALDLVTYIKRCAGETGLPEGVKKYDDLDRWFDQVFAGQGWFSSHHRMESYDILWKALSPSARRKLGWYGAWKYPNARKLMFEDAFDLWLPLAIGISGLVAVIVRWVLVGA